MGGTVEDGMRVQPERAQCVDAAKSVQLVSGAEMGMDITRQNGPNWVGRRLMESKRDRSQVTWACGCRNGHVALAPCS
jgi:hypothetical protein